MALTGDRQFSIFNSGIRTNAFSLENTKMKLHAMAVAAIIRWQTLFSKKYITEKYLAQVFATLNDRTQKT